MGKEIGHIELLSKDLMATKKFYNRLFGWKFEMFGDQYREYRQRVGMLFPWRKSN